MTTTPVRSGSARISEGVRHTLGRSPLRVMALGMLLLQVAWIFAVPPFRGSDEFDHVYKAAAVARGDWFPSPTAATRGTGAWLDVPVDIVDAARPQCEDLVYTKDEDCVGTIHGDRVRVASGAGRYHPLFYALVGTPAAMFDGHAALYVMRLMTALLGWLLFCAAVLVTRLWAKGAWPMTALAVATTPVLIYSSSVVAPNGIEMAAGLAFWSALVAVVRTVESTSRHTALAAAAVAGSVLVTMRSFGPLWCLLIVVSVTVTAWPGRKPALALVKDRAVWLAASIVVAFTLLSCAYIVSFGSLDVGTARNSYSLDRRIEVLYDDIPLWILQSIAAFPLRNEPTAPVVYACYLVLFIALLVLAFHVAQSRHRWGLALTMGMSSLVPFAICVATFNSFAGVWQGRYALPYSAGIAVLAGFALDHAGVVRVSSRLRFVGIPLYVVAQTVGPVDVMQNALNHPLSDASEWIHPPLFGVAILASIGAVLLGWGSTSYKREPATHTGVTRGWHSPSQAPRSQGGLRGNRKI